MSGSEELFELINAIDDIPNEGARIPLVEEAIRLADQCGEAYWSFDLRMDLVRYCVFHGQGLKALPAFSYCLAESQKPDSEWSTDDILWEYKWINNYATDFHEVSLEKINELREDFKQKLTDCGYGLYSYWYLVMNQSHSMNEKEQAEHAYNEMYKYKRDGMSDCRACVQDGLVDHAIYMDNYPLALELAEPILKGRMSCAEVPHYTYGHLLMPAYYAGDTVNAAEIEKKGYRKIYKNMEFLGIIGDFLLYYAYTNPQTALERYPKFVPWSFDSFTTHIRKFDFASSAAAMFKKLIEQGIDNAKLILPKEHPLYNADDSYSLHSLFDYHCKVAGEIGSKLDTRNGNTGFKDKLNTKLDRI